MALSKIPNYLQDLIDSDAIGSSAVTSAKIGSLPSGSVLQVVSALGTDTSMGTSSTAYVALEGISLAITPSSSSSKIMVMTTLSRVNNYTDNYGVRFKLYRDGSNVQPQGYIAYFPSRSSSSVQESDTLTWMVLDSPNTTSEVIYRPYGRCNDGNGTSYFIDGVEPYMVAMEIAG